MQFLKTQKICTSPRHSPKHTTVYSEHDQINMEKNNHSSWKGSQEEKKNMQMLKVSNTYVYWSPVKTS